MLFWSVTIAITVVACAALYYAAAGRPVNATAGMDQATTSHFRMRLDELDADVKNGELPRDQAEAARAEIARELVRQQADARRPRGEANGVKWAVPASLVVIAGLSFAVYLALGSPNLPGQPLAGREAGLADKLTLDQAIARIEAQLVKTPDDMRGWQVLAPVYMREGRYADAEHAFRQIIRLSKPTAQNQTDLAEALMMEKGGDATGEATTLLQSAAAMDPTDVRSRFYLAGEDMRKSDWSAAVKAWQAVLALSRGGEAWLPTAQNGLATAEARRDGRPVPPDATTGRPAPGPGGGAVPDQKAILAMVAGLQQRLESKGGTVAEWTRLVRSRLVLGETDKAQKAYDEAKTAYPSAADRADLDDLALSNGLH